jgi:SAM-dependent methyltransferase
VLSSDRLTRLGARLVRTVARRGQLTVDRLRGLDFLSVLEPEQVGLDAASSHRSSPSGNRYLNAALRRLGIGSRDAIIDVGCGKGSAMRTMDAFPFARVDGIEISATIAAIAERNFVRLGMRKSTVFVRDASRFDEFDAYNFVYFYNPFPASVMKGVADALGRSLARRPRELVIVYNNPVCHEVLVACSFTRHTVFPDEWGNGISVYSSRFDAGSRLSALK